MNGRALRLLLGCLAWAAACGAPLVLVTPVLAADALQPAPADETGQTAPPAETDAAASAGKGSGLPLPRFASLRTAPINLRTGPGVRYPVDWVYTRRHLPVEIVGEFDTWRRIKDPDGTEGWVHQSMLAGHRNGIVRGKPGEVQRLRLTANEQSQIVATLEPGVVIAVERCPQLQVSYCFVEADGLKGWLRREEFWGVYPDEVVE